MQAGFDRADGNAQGRRDIRQRHPKEGVQDDDRPSPLVEPPHCGIDDLAIGQGARDVADGRPIDRVEFDLDDPSAPTAPKIEASVDGQSMEPGVEALGVTQPREIAPGSDECLLDRVAGQLRIPEDETGGTVQPRGGPAYEFGEGVMIASPRSLDESWLVHGRLGFGTPW